MEKVKPTRELFRFQDLGERVSLWPGYWSEADKCFVRPGDPGFALAEAAFLVAREVDQDAPRTSGEGSSGEAV